MPRLGYVLEECDGTLHFFTNKHELAEWIMNESERQIKKSYRTDAIDKVDGSRIRSCLYRQSDSEVVQD